MSSRPGITTGLGFAVVLLLNVALGQPAYAQKMHDDGILLPWFRTQAERLDRQACENNLPECRDSVRQELATEKMITTLAPWVLLCLLLLGAVRYARRREAQREKRRHEAERHHAREARAPRRPTRAALDEEDAAPAEDDTLGFGHPGDSHPR